MATDDYEDEERRRQESIERAMQEGVIWLNSIFRFRDSRRRLFGSRGPRVTKLEVFWALFIGLIVLLIVIGLYQLFGTPVVLAQILWGPIAWFLWPIVLGWQGRKVAHMSPLRRRTGEGTGTWLWITIKRSIVRVSFIIQRPVMYNKCITQLADNDGTPTVVECIEWIGTARAPRMPYISDPTDVTASTPVILKPRGIAAIRVPRKQRR